MQIWYLQLLAWVVELAQVPPIIAKAAMDRGAPTVAVVTKPSLNAETLEQMTRVLQYSINFVDSLLSFQSIDLDSS